MKEKRSLKIGMKRKILLAKYETAGRPWGNSDGVVLQSASVAERADINRQQIYGT